MSEREARATDTSPVFRRIIGVLDQHGASYRLLHHEPTRTSQESARVRDEDISIGAKAIVMKLDRTYAMFVLSAALRLDSRAVRSHLSVKKTRFASAEELFDLTGLVPGSVPPFGHPVVELDLYADPSVFENERVAFNAGSLTDSVIMSSEEYRRLARPNVFPFSMK
jgi:prolyl-tRNA editing enzyme YbaK/EbsC (Cys-tRNA(Pro) deacylase)